MTEPLRTLRRVDPADGRVRRGVDAELLARLAEGDIGALGELYDRHQASVRRFLTRAMSGSGDVDDLVHTTFLTAATSAARYDGRSECRPWLIGIAVRLLRRQHHAVGRWFAVLSAIATLRRPSLDPRSALDAKSDVERALARLTHAKRVTLLLAEVEGLTCPEIALALEIPVGTVWTRLHSARREIRELLDAEKER